MPEHPRDTEAIRAGIERARQEIEQSVSALRANVSETLNWMWSTWLLFHKGSKMPLEKRKASRFCTVSLPR